jgi:hypothetical protein
MGVSLETAADAREWQKEIEALKRKAIPKAKGP